MSARRWAAAQARNAFVTGNIAGLAAIAAAKLFARSDAAPLNAVSHIWTGLPPVVHDAMPTPRNAAIGFLLHQGAAVFWAGFFEPLFGKAAERSSAAGAIGGASVAAAAYVTDYHIVSSRFRPGFKASMSGGALFLVYAALAAGFAASARLRGLRHHQVEDHDEGEESRDAERRPEAVIPPVSLR